jgi:flagellar motility protein MotE (MotC chaperone)
MRAILIISTVTFLLIFGGLVLVSTVLKQASGGPRGEPALSADDQSALDRVAADLTEERDRVQTQKEGMLVLDQRLAVQKKILTDATAGLAKMIEELGRKQEAYDEERERSAKRLARMYEAMKPDRAAPILSTLEMDVVLEIMSRMKERPAAKILGQMDAGLAAEISARLSSKGAG